MWYISRAVPIHCVVTLNYSPFIFNIRFNYSEQRLISPAFSDN